jgi:hypothetical protein
MESRVADRTAKERCLTINRRRSKLDKQPARAVQIWHTDMNFGHERRRQEFTALLVIFRLNGWQSTKATEKNSFAFD